MSVGEVGAAGGRRNGLHSAAGAYPGDSVDLSSLKGKSLTTLGVLEAEEIRGLLDASASLRKAFRGGQERAWRPFTGRSLAMIFQKRSTRTRVSSETGFSMLGGHALFLGSEDVQLGVNETLKDSARVLSRFNDIILARVFEHETILELERESDVPIINALSEKFHPLQILADFMTLEAEWGGAGSLQGKTIAWVGDGNNILHSILAAGPKMGLNVRVATPAGYEPDTDVVDKAQREAAALGTSVVLTTVPEEAVNGADAVVTDTWVSMGQEEEKKKRLQAFAGYQVSSDMLARGGANPDAKFLHCLPRKPEEVTDELFYSPRSLVWDEAENRMWTVMAVFAAQLNGGL